MIRAWVLALLALLAAVSGVAPAHAARVTEFTPQGEVGVVESVSVQFDAPMVPLGDDQLPAPVALTCSDPALRGQGRWVDDRRWVYNFFAPPGPGVQCRAKLADTLRTAEGKALRGGPVEFAFQTGGPQVLEMRPHAYSPIISEDQVFALRFNGAVDTDSLLANSRCTVEGLGESVPVRLIDGAERSAIQETLYFSAEGSDAAVQLLQCQRLLPAQAKVRLTVGPGLRAAGSPDIRTSSAETFDYEVRGPFRAEFSCLRENAKADCTPVSALRLSFSAPISREDARRIRLKTPTQDLVPAQDNDDYQADVTQVSFEGPFPENASLLLMLPEGLADDAGRSLSNAAQFPLTVRTAQYPPLVKFAAAPFGVVERFAEAPLGGSDEEHPPVVPLTVRNVEAALGTSALSIHPGELRNLAFQDDLQVLRWYARLRMLDEGQWSAAQLRAIMESRNPEPDDGAMVDTRSVSVLAEQPAAMRRMLPAQASRETRPFEVIGIPLEEPGFHVLEVASARLGRSLLPDQQVMYVRSGVLVTNLAVHIKKGRDDLLAWVTTLDDGQVVDNAQITVMDCDGTLLAQGKTGQNGLWHLTEPLSAADYCEDTRLSGVYVSARIGADHPQARGKADFSFAFSDWDRGIEPWRFNLPVNLDASPTMTAHTVFDRPLLRAGETVSMKHYLRELVRQGMALPPVGKRPDQVIITHEGSGQQTTLALDWQETPSGGLSAYQQFQLPQSARLGSYVVTLTDGEGMWFETGRFRVEAFRLPVLAGSLKISSEDGGPVLVAPRNVSLDMQLSYLSGGAAAGLPVQVSAVARNTDPVFAGYEDFDFHAPDSDAEEAAWRGGLGQAPGPRLFLDKAPLVMDASGGSRLVLDAPPEVSRPQVWQFEAGFMDPNGQVQTLSQSTTVWPAAVQAGIRVHRWVQVGQSAEIQVVALSSAGQPQAGVTMTVMASSRTVYSTRKRLVGGFYSYDSHSQTRTLGKVCEGRTDEQGLLSCTMELNTPGEIQFIARAHDAGGRVSAAASSVWVTGADEIWFGGESADRIDLLPARKRYAPGDTAEFQVRMPFRQATVLLAVEREGVLGTQVVELQGKDPTVRLTIRPEWGPNVYVSVLAVRGRLRQTPWHSFLSWGWQRPAQWVKAFRSNDQGYSPPTPFIDLAKPAFRHGVAEIQVSDTRDQLLVQVQPDRAQYRVREVANVGIQVVLPDGRPAANATVAFAAVDQALLELSPNESWDLLSAMRQRRSYGVNTATTQLEVVGRRHYGRKALPAGGGGGASPTRELLDTLLLWEPQVQLDAQGRALVAVPLNDSISQFALVAVADHGPARFGTGQASIVTTQDLQVISGLPPLVREGDRYQASVTVRNASARAMRVQLDAFYEHKGKGHPGSLAPQVLELAAGSARTVQWPVQAPQWLDDAGELLWRFQARELSGAQDRSEDALSMTQTVLAAVPVRTHQATLLSLEPGAAPVSLPFAAPQGALQDAAGGRLGGLQVELRSRLAGDGLSGVHAWFADYPYTCTEQLASRAIGMRDAGQWEALMRELPGALDGDGLVAYFPGMRQGSEVLTAYLLSASHEARKLGLPFEIPAQTQQAMVDGLTAFAQGRIVRSRWAPRHDLDLRKLAALEALTRYRVNVSRLIDTIAVHPDQWPSAAVIDWLQILQRSPQMPGRSAHMRKAEDVLRARLLQRGSEAVLGESAPQAPWWLMHSRQTEQARLLQAISGQPGWAEDAPRIAQGLLNLQSHGAWRTTTENLLGSLAIEKFSRQYERKPVTGVTQIGGMPRANAVQFVWDGRQSASGAQVHRLTQPWPAGQAPAALLMQHTGSGRVWAQLSAQAAVPRVAPVFAGFSVQRQVLPVSQAVPDAWSVGDVFRVRLTVHSQTTSSWVVVNDPIPAGATILGSGLGRDSAIQSRPSEDAPQTQAVPSFVERAFEGLRAYYETLPAGETVLEYTVRLSTPGQFQLPGTRVEALYQPDVYGALPDLQRLDVQ